MEKKESLVLAEGGGQLIKRSFERKGFRKRDGSLK